MEIESNVLLFDLIECTHLIIDKAESWKDKSDVVLNYKLNAEDWSILECLEHLNLYGRFYIPEITKRLSGRSHEKTELYFKSGWLGNYFAKSMLPKAKLNTMKTFKSMNPVNSKLDKAVITEFINQQKQLIELLNKTKDISLNKTKTAISITKWVQIKLGDTFRIVIYHNQRHIVQAEKALNLANNALAKF